METEIELLKEQVNALSTLLTEEKSRRKNLMVARHKQAFEKLRAAISDSRELQNDQESLIRELDLADFLGLIAQVNSPVEQKMGFAFLDVVYNAVENILLPLDGGPGNANHKIRFTEVLQKVLNNPIASILLKTNPVTGIIGKVVDLASGFVDSVIDRTDGRGANKLKVVTREVMSNERINAFAEQMRKYERLYGDLAKTLTGFRKELAYVKAGMWDSLEAYSDAYCRFLELLSLDKETPFIGLEQVFRLDDSGWTGMTMEELESVTADDRISVALRFAGNMDAAETRMNMLRTRFGKALETFRSDFVAVLQRPLAEGWEDVDIDRNMLQLTITEIKAFTERSSLLATPQNKNVIQ